MILKGASTYNNALNFIKENEGGPFLKAYQDSNKVWTIGWGSTFHFDKERQVQNNDIITFKQAQKWLELQTGKDAIEIKKIVKIPLTNNELNSLISFVYNIGINAFKKSTFLKLLNNKIDKKLVANEFDKWIYDNGKINKGLINRRNAEKSLFLS